MKIIERLKKDKEKFYSIKDRKDKAIFVWDYYKIPIICIAICFVIVVYSAISNIGKKPVLMYSVLLNSDSSVVEVDEQFFVDELARAGVDTEGKIVDINDYLSLGKDDEDIETLQVLNALFTLDNLDLFVAFKNDFELFVDKDAYCDLSLLIDKDLLSKCDLYEGLDSTGNKIVAGIVLHDGSPLHRAGYYHSDVVVGVASNAVYMDNALSFIKQIISE